MKKLKTILFRLFTLWRQTKLVLCFMCRRQIKIKTMLLLPFTLIISISFCSCNSKQNQISDEEINTLIQGRNQIISLLMYSNLEYDIENKVSSNGIDYYRVIDEKYDEWSEWRDYVKSIYIDEAAETVLSDPKVIEINGNTYTNDGCMGNSISDEYAYEIISEEENTVTILLKNTDNFTSEPVETEIILNKTSNGWRIKNY